LADLEEAAKEARLIALRLLSLKAAGQPVWDEAAGRYRPVEWRDISILLRAPSNKAESYAKEFTRLNVPLQVARGGFYDSLEIADLLSLLQVLDNPLQDLPLLALLRSPLVGLTLDELAAIRIAARHTSYWTALLRWKETNTVHTAQSTVHGPQAAVHSPQWGESPKSKVQGSNSEDSPQSTARAEASTPALYEKISLFLECFARWRRLARQVALSRCLETILAETQYEAWLSTQPRGEQRCANLKRLLQLAQRFDQLQRQGLFRFLRFVEAQQRAQAEPELTAISTENSVRLMSIHQSKGLEFPVVVVADLGKPFNLADLQAEIILDERYGLCPQVKPPHIGKRYPSLPHWLAARQQKRELLGEELRLLYVAMTRAKDRLILSASITRQSFATVWSHESESPEPAAHKARSFADWVGAWFRRNVPALRSSRGNEALIKSVLRPVKPRTSPDQKDQSLITSAATIIVPSEGRNAFLCWTIQDNSTLAATLNGPAEEAACPSPPQVDLCVWHNLEQRFDRLYPYSTSTRLPAKTSVSKLRQRAIPDGEEEEASTALSLPQLRTPGAPGSWPDRGGQNTSRRVRAPAVDVGIAHHQFLQLVSLERAGSEELLKEQAEQFAQQGAIEKEDLQLLDFRALAAFWTSSLGNRIRQQSASVRRELPFTFRLAAAELAALTGDTPEDVAPDDFVVVQGIADLAVVLPQEIWLVDFKTDRITADEQLAAKGYEQQLRLYAYGLSLLFHRPVTEAWLHFLSANKSVRVALEA
jgi:ATP-dependent helicase/nuclease subunit A